MKSSLVKRILVGGNIWVTLIRGCALASVCVVVFKFVYLPMWIEGESMAPTYKTGGFNFVNRLAYRNREPQRGDVVAIRLVRRGAMLMKRVIGLPGERIEIRRGTVYINGQPLDEPYVVHAPDGPGHKGWRSEEIQLDEDEYFVIGDNRGMPANMHVLGRVSRDRIVGKVAF